MLPSSLSLLQVDLKKGSNLVILKVGSQMNSAAKLILESISLEGTDNGGGVHCDLCAAGRFANSSTGMCQTCPSGSFSSAGAAACTLCPVSDPCTCAHAPAAVCLSGCLQEGSEGPLAGASSCAACASGLSAPSAGSVMCTVDTALQVCRQ